jgi:hypothetical protein
MTRHEQPDRSHDAHRENRPALRNPRASTPPPVPSEAPVLDEADFDHQHAMAIRDRHQYGFSVDAWLGWQRKV